MAERRFIWEIIPRTLHFKQPAGTSRGTYLTRDVWYLSVSEPGNPQHRGIGECAPLPGLSREYDASYEEKLRHFCRCMEETGQIDKETLRAYPSILFGIETAMRAYEKGGFTLWDSPFARGEAGIRINGLVWMGDYETMLRRIDEKLTAGFHCIKLKIGAIHFEDELRLLRHVRNHFPTGAVELRVDANGAFSPDEAGEKLEKLAAFGLHSIEQPIRAGQWEEMARLCEESPIPVALDEELIGITTPTDKSRLIETIRPAYLVLKPSLHGGIHGCEEWIQEAETLLSKTDGQPAWWITSALESNIGLNALAQWCATLGNPLPQGLGTGQLFLDNTKEPRMEIRGEKLYRIPE